MDTMDENSGFQDWLQAELDKRTWNMAELARQASTPERPISQSAISQVMLKKNRLGVKLASAIARALELPEDIVFEMGGLKSPSKRDESGIMRELALIFSHLDTEDQQLLIAQARLIRKHRRRNRDESSPGDRSG